MTAVNSSSPISPCFTHYTTCFRSTKQNRRLGNGKSFKSIRAVYGFRDVANSMLETFAVAAGAAFYGKRKSNFYGEGDRMKKENPTTPDPLEDYQGPSQAGYFQWQRDEEGQMRVS